MTTSNGGDRSGARPGETAGDIRRDLANGLKAIAEHARELDEAAAAAGLDRRPAHGIVALTRRLLAALEDLAPLDSAAIARPSAAPTAIGLRSHRHRRERYLDAIADTLGDVRSLDLMELLTDFASSLEEAIIDGEEAMSEDDLGALAGVLHRTAPSLELVGEVELARQTRRVEQAARGASPQQAGRPPGPLEVAALRGPWRALTGAWQTIVSDLALVASDGVITARTSRPMPASTELRAMIPGLKALVVDDDPFMRKLVADMMGGLGATRVLSADNGLEALSAIDQQEQVELLLCDLAMPGLDGIELLRRLADRKFEGSIIVMSIADDRVLASVDELARQLGLKMLGALRKPFEAAALEALIRHQPPPERQRSRTTELGSQPFSAEDLESAMRAGEIGIHLQPKVDVRTLAFTGVEVLARWFRSDGSQTPPSAFIRAAEKHQLAELLFQVILPQALAAAKRLGPINGPPRIAVNVSASSLMHLETVDQVLASLEKAGLAPSQLSLEVTETGLVRDFKVALAVLNRLRVHGVGLSIDDFGTGYSSIDLLRRAPFDELKVDRSFVMNAVRDRSARHIIASSVSMARGLGLRVVAEGVETIDELELVRDLGCDELQGYLVARPMAEPDLAEWLTRRQARPIT